MQKIACWLFAGIFRLKALLLAPAHASLWYVHVCSFLMDSGGLWPADFQRQPQGLGDLGERLARAFKRAPPGPVAVIGTDIPDLSGKLIRTAFNALRRRDVVFGPADDGGFWLFAASHAMRRQPIAFAPVRWSTPHAMSDLIASLPASTRITRLRTLADLDDAASLKEWSCRR